MCKGPAVMSRWKENAENLFFSHSTIPNPRSRDDIIGWLCSCSSWILKFESRRRIACVLNYNLCVCDNLIVSPLEKQTISEAWDHLWMSCHELQIERFSHIFVSRRLLFAKQCKFWVLTLIHRYLRLRSLGLVKSSQPNLRKIPWFQILFLKFTVK